MNEKLTYPTLFFLKKKSIFFHAIMLHGKMVILREKEFVRFLIVVTAD